MLVPLVAISLIFVGIVICGLIVVGLASILPRIRCSKWARFAISAALFLVGLPVMIWCMTWGSRALIIVLAYGLDEYAAGLWIIDRYGNLSDGRSLSEFWDGAWGAAMFLSLLVPNLPLMVFHMLSDKAPNSGASHC